MTKEEYINYWISQSADDWDTVQVLASGRKYLQALFWLHLSIEKLCKAVWIHKNDGNIPPRIHNLSKIMVLSGIDIPKEFGVLMIELNRFQLEGRYPDFVSDLYKTATAELVKEYVERSSPLRTWLLNLLPSN